MNKAHVTDNPPKLSKFSQPPLSHAGATPDADRAKRPPLAEPSATGPELSPGDRVEGLGNFGVPTGQLGTVERANEDDAVVKWDGDGRMRLGQSWLKKISNPAEKIHPIVKHTADSIQKRGAHVEVTIKTEAEPIIPGK